MHKVSPQSVTVSHCDVLGRETVLPEPGLDKTYKILICRASAVICQNQLPSLVRGAVLLTMTPMMMKSTKATPAAMPECIRKLFL